MLQQAIPQRIVLTWAGEKSALEPRRPYLGFVPSDSALAGPLQPRRGVIRKKRVPVDAEALKGRNPDCAGPRSRPFRATDLVIGSLPRALPWAFLFRPFGAEEGLHPPRSGVFFMSAHGPTDSAHDAP